MKPTILAKTKEEFMEVEALLAKLPKNILEQISTAEKNPIGKTLMCTLNGYSAQYVLPIPINITESATQRIVICKDYCFTIPIKKDTSLSYVFHAI